MALLGALLVGRAACGVGSGAGDDPATGPASSATLPPGLRATGVPAPPFDARAVLHGRVIRPDGAPAPGATVRLIAHPAGVESPPVVSDADGRFSFEQQPIGGYLLEAQHEDEVSPTVDHVLLPRAPAVTLVLLPGAAVHVLVVDRADGSPIADAEVGLSTGDAAFGTGLGAPALWRTERTGADGIARIRGVLPTSNHRIFARAPGYVVGWSNLLEGGFAGRRTWTATVQLRPGAMLSGRVTDERGQPVAGARVGFDPEQSEPIGVAVLSPLPFGGRFDAATSDEDGRYRGAFDPGTGCVVAVHTRYRMAERCGVELALGREQAGVDLVLRDGVQVSGVVVDGDGAFVPGATVLVTMRGAELLPQFYEDHRHVTRADMRGQFSFPGLDPVPIALYAFTDDASSALVDVDLTGGDDESGVIVELAHAASLAGAVLERAGGPVPYATVVFRPNALADPEGFETDERAAASAAHTPERWTMTRTHGAVRADDQGRFAIRGIPEGAYSLTATRPAVTSVPGSYGESTEQVVFTGDEVALILPGLGGLRGRVVHADGSPAADAGVSVAMGALRVGEDMYPPATPATDGDFELESVPQGTYTLRVTATGAQAWHSDAIEVRAGEVTDLGTIRLDRGVSRRGIVVAVDGGPAPGAQILAVTPDRQYLLEAGADGRFLLPTLAAAVPLRVRGSDGDAASPWIDVEPHEREVRVVLSEPATGAIHGVIVGPAQGRLVAAVATEGKSPEETPPAATARAGEGGAFALGPLPAGTYWLWLHRAERAGEDPPEDPMWAPHPTPVEVIADRVVDTVIAPQGPADAP